jgi:hypothetical protein
VSDAANLPVWAQGFCRSVRRDGAEWVAETADGSLRLRFVTWNQWGVLDHVLKMPSGETVVVPMRVIPNGSGSELLLTLFQRPGVSDAQFYEDASLVYRDLQALKQILEGTPAGAERSER